MKIFLLIPFILMAWFVGQSLWTQFGGKGLQAIVDEHGQRNTGDAFISAEFANSIIFLDESKRDTEKLKTAAAKQVVSPADWAKNGVI
jgi:hypothetical protein